MNNIEILEHLIKSCHDENDILYKLDKETKKALENLIQENQKLKKQMGKDLDVVYIKGVYDERDKWKSKVKEKIEELEKRKQDLLQLPDDCARTLGLEDCDEKIISYKELLEEGE